MKSHAGGSHTQKTEFQRLGILGGTITDFKMEPYSDYHFRVRVVTKDGYNGTWSNEYHILSSGIDRVHICDCEFCVHRNILQGFSTFNVQIRSIKPHLELDGLRKYFKTSEDSRYRG